MQIDSAGVGSRCQGLFPSYYLIQAGDTVSTISASCGVAVSAMLAANGQITDPDVIQTGSQLCVPSNCSHATSLATPGVVGLRHDS